MSFLYIVTFLVGGGLGSCWRELWELSQRIRKLEHKPEPQSHVTLGQYLPANETKQTSGVINPKTPQQMEYLAQEQKRKIGLGL